MLNSAGASIGTLLGGRLPERLRDTLVAALGLFTLALGVQQALAAFGDDLSGAVGRSAPLLVLAALLAFASLSRLGPPRAWPCSSTRAA